MYIKQKLIAQFICKSRNESFKPNYSIIKQCLSNKNKNTTISKSKKFCEVNKALFFRSAAQKRANELKPDYKVLRLRLISDITT